MKSRAALISLAPAMIVPLHPINEDLPLDLLMRWLGSMPVEAAEMYRHRLCVQHPGQHLEALTLQQLLEHLEVVIWAYEQGARKGKR